MYNMDCTILTSEKPNKWYKMQPKKCMKLSHCGDDHWKFQSDWDFKEDGWKWKSWYDYDDIIDCASAYFSKNNSSDDKWFDFHKLLN